MNLREEKTNIKDKLYSYAGYYLHDSLYPCPIFDGNYWDLNLKLPKYFFDINAENNQKVITRLVGLDEN